MTSLNLASNSICIYGNMDGIKAISSAIKVRVIILVPFSSLSDLSFNCCSTAGVCYYPQDMGALSVLSLKSNRLRADGGKALAEGLKGNTVITELDISSNDLGEDSNYEPDMSGVIALADVIPGMGALTKLDISRNNIPSDQEGRLQRTCAAGGTELAV
jgi:hypothetical protein